MLSRHALGISVLRTVSLDLTEFLSHFHNLPRLFLIQIHCLSINSPNPIISKGICNQVICVCVAPPHFSPCANLIIPFLGALWSMVQMHPALANTLLPGIPSSWLGLCWLLAEAAWCMCTALPSASRSKDTMDFSVLLCVRAPLTLGNTA